MIRPAILVLTLIALVSTAQAVNGDVIFVDEANDDFRIASITDLDVDGVLYNVTFHNETDWQSGPFARTFDDYLANSGVTDPITFNSFSDAVAASVAVRAEIAAASVDASSGTDSLLFYDIPFALTPTTVSLALSTRTSTNPLLYNSAITPVTVGRGAANLGPSVAILEFDVIGIPEPSTWALLTLAGIGFGGYQLRRKQQRVTE